MSTPHPAVSLVRCASYRAGVREAMERLLSELGGIGRFVQPGQSVLIKPNLLTERAPHEAVTTHPVVVRALIGLLKDAGAKPCVADSPASAVKLERVWEKTGFRALCDEEDVPLINLEKAGSRHFDVDGCSFCIARPVLEADVVVNVPKVKTHVLTTLTAAVKNMYGAVPGYHKTQLHKAHPRPGDFGRLMSAVYRHAPPHLSIADGIVGMEGDGPSGGEPKTLGFLAASADAVALDLTLCRILGIAPDAVPYLEHLREEGVHDTIDVRGASLRDVAPRSFRTPNTLRVRLIPRPLVRLLAPHLWIRPVFGESCVSCGQCIEACPASALCLRKGERPELTAKACIGCCCCHEVCPAKAVTMNMSPLLSFVRRGRMV
jgi:uncharacterized protein (DUF362 family)/Pyruvate/2-oxoacid:ferredoxin oxidoreductase delta subunit